MSLLLLDDEEEIDAKPGGASPQRRFSPFSSPAS
jgi:hypothetical protein